ncbi:MAG: hypothetical protein AUI62_04380 [Thaumarchaeota archaeon 13_1_40CM_2_39_7]|nr:MAG: hypothetical protein AUI62_04380 [Thaumarchaeota archaeon 13_1_40CM_2_39_7]
MAKWSLARGPIIAGIALVVVVIGANLFDSAYESVEPVLKNKQTIIDSKTIPLNQFINSTIPTGYLREHNVLLMHLIPLSGSVKLFGIEPSGMTFEKESKNGFLYHIIQKSKSEGIYSIQISNSGSEPVQVGVIIGEDPYLSGNCNSGIECYTVQAAIGLVIVGIIAFIVGILIGARDFRKENKTRQNQF